MEGNSPVEKRRTMKNVKQYSRSTSRNKLSLENTLPGSDLPKGVALEPVGLRGELSRSPHSVLEGKVKALKEKRVTMKQGGVLFQEHLSPKKTKVKKGKLLLGPAVVEGVTPDAVVEPRAQIRTYLTDVVLDSRDDADCGQRARRAMLTGPWDSNVESVKGHRTVGEHAALSQSSADVLWRFPTPGTNIMENAEYPESGGSRGSPDGFWDAGSYKNAVSSSHKSSLRENGRPALPASCGEEMTQATDFESIPFVPRYDSCGAASSGWLWRADSWESIGSTGSTASVLSLAERVERNRMMLQEMLSLSGQSRGLQESRTLHQHEGEGSLLAKNGPGHELLLSDVDWDSGVSLQDSEGYRAFVPSQELELSPRHEQAKQLLQRARMKARTSPLRASHDILPAVTQDRRNFQHKCESMMEEQKDQLNPKGLSKSKCQALSANNCNNTQAKHQQSGLDESHGQHEWSDQKVSGSLGETKGLSSGADPSAAPSTIGSAVVTSLASKELDCAHTTQLPDQKAVGPRLQKAKQLVEGSITPCKPLGTQPEPKKSASSTASRKGGSSSASGLKKFFSVLSQNTKQKLGRFRCYSMEQLPPEAPGSVQPPEVRSNATECSKMKKSPSLQSLRLMPPFSQPRKASSVQNLHSFLGKTDRSNAYLVVEPEEDRTTDRKVGILPRRSLSVEDIGTPDLVRTVGRVVEVFPDGTNQLELQRPPGGTFGFRVSSGNGRPDTGPLLVLHRDTALETVFIYSCCRDRREPELLC
uniref:KIAA1614 n=1 Tax=Crocodylus porosus TaxID=8502 RepID=A0A7M4EK81_CROPO